MITIETLCLQVEGLTRADVEHWIVQAWVRPEGEPGHYLFRDIDVARVRLIMELRRDMRVEDESLPIVLSLLDQLYAARRQLRRVRDVIARHAPEEARQELLALLARVEEPEIRR